MPGGSALARWTKREKTVCATSGARCANSPSLLDAAASTIARWRSTSVRNGRSAPVEGVWSSGSGNVILPIYRAECSADKFCQPAWAFLERFGKHAVRLVLRPGRIAVPGCLRFQRLGTVWPHSHEGNFGSGEFGEAVEIVAGVLREILIFADAADVLLPAWEGFVNRTSGAPSHLGLPEVW